MKFLRIGVLGFQGAIEEHISMTEKALSRLDIEGRVLWIKKASDIEKIHGLIIPGGESTVIGRLAAYSGLLEKVKTYGKAGMPIFGTCAGMVMLASQVYDRVVGKTTQPILGLMDITVERNAFGRQRDSFEVDLVIPVLGERKFKGIFIRAPIVRKIGLNVEPLCYLNKDIVAVKRGNMLATSFHPELTDDIRFHEYFLKLVLHACNVKTGESSS
jgi:5'-phosphate synthase pdxT subunit